MGILTRNFDPIELWEAHITFVDPSFFVFSWVSTPVPNVSEEPSCRKACTSHPHTLTNTHNHTHTHSHTHSHTEVGIPPLHITQNLQLAQFRYCLSTNKNNIISHTLYVREQRARAIMNDDTMGRRMHKAICQVDRDNIDPHAPNSPLCPHQSSKPNRRTAKNHTGRSRKILSSTQLQSKLLGPPGRLREYVHWHLCSDTLGRNLYRPAPCLTHRNAKHQLEMLRIRTQGWIYYLPSHLHHQRGQVDQAPYQYRLCPLCLPAAGPTLGDEKHIISQCPASWAVLHDPKFFNIFQGLMRPIDTQPFQLLDCEEQIRVALGTAPPSLMCKDFHTWRQEATVMCGEFAHALRMHLRPLQPIIPSLSSDDDSARESDDEEPPPG